jgi:hypothetical protein
MCSVKLKQTWKDKSFDDMETTEHYATEHLLMISKTEFEICYKRGHK